MKKNYCVLAIMILVFGFQNIVFSYYDDNSDIIIFDDGESGMIVGAKRWENATDESRWISIKNGTGGFQLKSYDGTRELMAVDNFGGIYFEGDLYLNGKKINNYFTEESQYISKEDFLLTIVSIILLFTALIVLITYMFNKKVNKLSYYIQNLQ